MEDSVHANEVKWCGGFYWCLLPHLVGHLPYDTGLAEGVVLGRQGNACPLACLLDNVFAGVYEAAVHRSVWHSNEGRCGGVVVRHAGGYGLDDWHTYAYVHLC